MIDIANFNGNNYCTIAGHKYLFKLLSLYSSICKMDGNFHLFVLCIDDNTYWFLQKACLKNVSLIHLNQIENEELLRVKYSRKLNEYCWTLKAPFIMYILTFLQARSVIYCDSDIYLFSDPRPMFDALNRNSIYLCPQRDAVEIEKMYGKYQAGIIGFKNDSNALQALTYWHTKCLEKCSSNLQPDDDTFGDQKYLDNFPGLFQGVFCETNLGVDAAPWNCVYRNKGDFNVKDNQPFLYQDKIIAFHFATMNIFNENEYDLWSYGKVDMQNNILYNLYIPYIEALRQSINLVRTIDPSVEWMLYFDQQPQNAQTYFSYDEKKKVVFKFDEFFELCSIVSESYVTRAMALYSSIKRHNDNFHMWYCAVDDNAAYALKSLNLRNATIINLKDIMTHELENIKNSRSLKEFCWTLKSFFVDYLLKTVKLDRVLYLDSDMYMFADLKYIYSEWHTYSFMMCTQRADEKTEKTCGFYQAGLLGIKNDDYGNRVLSWWKDRCFEWCHDNYDAYNNRWGDQKYLEKVPYDFENIKIVTNFGINTAPWNIMLNDPGYEVYLDNNRVFISNIMLCAYHFGSIGIKDNGAYDIWIHDPIEPRREIMELIYKPYFAQLDRYKGILNNIQSGWHNREEVFDDLLKR